MDDESDDRGSLRERLAALEDEVTGARAALAELRRASSEKAQRVAELEERLAGLERRTREKSTPRGKLFLGLFLLPFAALGGAFSGVTASLPLAIAGLSLDWESEVWLSALMIGFTLTGTLSALTLAVRRLKRA